MEQKFRFLAGLVIFVFVTLTIRLWYLQILEGATSMVKSRANQTRTIKINAPRGIFYDRKGRILVSSRLSHNVSVVPDDIKNKPEELALLSRLLNIPKATLMDKLKPDPKHPRNPYQYLPIAKDIPPDTAIKLLEEKFNLPGVEVDEVPVRWYRYGEIASHLFGYIREINDDELKKYKDQGYRMGDIIGKTGLEKTYEDTLRGEDGGKVFEVDITGRSIPLDKDKIDSVPGNNLRLTIDLTLQQAAEQALKDQFEYLQKYSKYHNAKSGAVIALDPRNGNILAMVSEPGFDPNLFAGTMPQDAYQKIRSEQALLNRNTQGTFAPGSTFKPITVFSALMEHKVTVKDKFLCNGYDIVWGKKLPCWISTATSGPREHGWETVIDGLKNSCNVVMAALSRLVGPEKLAQYARFFGLGKPTGLNLYPQESSGLVPDPEWKKKRRPSGESFWSPVETGQLAIGQNALTVTPIQLAQVYAAIANGGKVYRPQVVSAITSPEGKVIKKFSRQLTMDLNISPQDRDIVQQGLVDVVNEGGTAGGAFSGFPLDIVPVAGKTGTAQHPPGDNDALFASYAPSNKPEIVVIVLIQQGGSGSGTAAPVARKILETYFADRIKRARAQQAAAKAQLLPKATTVPADGTTTWVRKNPTSPTPAVRSTSGPAATIPKGTKEQPENPLTRPSTAPSEPEGIKPPATLPSQPATEEPLTGTE